MIAKEHKAEIVKQTLLLICEIADEIIEDNDSNEKENFIANISLNLLGNAIFIMSENPETFVNNAELAQMNLNRWFKNKLIDFQNQKRKDKH